MGEEKKKMFRFVKDIVNIGRPLRIILYCLSDSFAVCCSFLATSCFYQMTNRNIALTMSDVDPANADIF